MTAYVDCCECGQKAPWYYAWKVGPEYMHPGCALDRIDEEGCGAVWFQMSQNDYFIKYIIIDERMISENRLANLK